MLDADKLTLEDIEQEFANTVDNLTRLRALYEAMLEGNRQQVRTLIEEYNRIKAEEVT